MGRAKLPLSSFDPRYRVLLLAGTRQRLELPAMEHGRATKLRQDMQEYRVTAKREKQPDWEPLYQSIVRLERLTETHSRIVIEPRNSSFNDVLPNLEEVAKQVGEPATDLKGLLDDLDKPPETNNG